MCMYQSNRITEIFVPAFGDRKMENITGHVTMLSFRETVLLIKYSLSMRMDFEMLIVLK